MQVEMCVMYVCVCGCVYCHAWKIQSAIPSESSKNCHGLANQVESSESHLSPGGTDDILFIKRGKG